MCIGDHTVNLAIMGLGTAGFISMGTSLDSLLRPSPNRQSSGSLGATLGFLIRVLILLMSPWTNPSYCLYITITIALAFVRRWSSGRRIWPPWEFRLRVSPETIIQYSVQPPSRPEHNLPSQIPWSCRRPPLLRGQLPMWLIIGKTLGETTHPPVF